MRNFEWTKWIPVAFLKKKHRKMHQFLENKTRKLCSEERKITMKRVMLRRKIFLHFERTTNLFSSCPKSVDLYMHCNLGEKMAYWETQEVYQRESSSTCYLKQNLGTQEFPQKYLHILFDENCKIPIHRLWKGIALFWCWTFLPY